MCPTLFNIPFLNLPIRGYGFMLMVAFLGGTYWAARRAARVKCDPDFVVNLGFIALIASVIGARIFYVIHYWDRFAGRGLWEMVNLTAGGLEFYGGFIGAFIASVGFILYKKASLRLYADIIAPSLMFGMGAARIGCFLNGCCWGAPCDPNMAWGVTFPFASPAHYRQWEERQVTVPAELLMVGRPSGIAYPLSREWVRASNHDKQAKQLLANQAGQFNRSPEELIKMAQRSEYRSLRLHPAQLYASLDGFILALLLSTIFYRRKRHGVVFGLLLLLYPLCRFCEEIIRIDNPHDTAGLTISQFVSLLIAVVGAAWLIAIYRMPIRSPLAVPFEPPPEPEPPKKQKKNKKQPKK